MTILKRGEVSNMQTSAPSVCEAAPLPKTRDVPVLHGFKDPVRAATIIYEGIPPKKIPFDDLVKLMRTPDNDDNVDKVYRNRIKGRLTAIRAFCVLCLGGSPKAVRMCSSIDCPLWNFRMGSNPFRNKK